MIAVLYTSFVVPYVHMCKVIEEIEPHQSEAAKLAVHKESNIHTQRNKQSCSDL
jgi:hypothetical protein